MRDYLEHPSKMIKKKLKQLTNDLKKNEFSFDPQLLKKHCTDWRGEFIGDSDLILFPESVKNLSKILNFCYKEKIPIVPQGGNTGLVGGSVPRKKKEEIIINLSNINKIRNIDLIGNSITLESGCILENIKNELAKYKLEFPLSMGSRGNCQIGGNIATNAGGVNVIKYGSIRQSILGLEAVLSDGTIYSSLKNVRKNNTGLDLKQLLIGSEGILGIITAATIKTFPLPKEKIVLWGSFENFKKVLDFYVLITRKFNDLITSFEFMNKESIDILEKNELRLENIKKNECYCLVEISNFQNINNFNDFIISKLNLKNIGTDDLIISKSESENRKLWSYRESIPLAERKEKIIIQHDVSIPLINIESFVSQTSKLIKKIEKSSVIINFGHLGDNNLHYNVLITESAKKINIDQIKKKINRVVFDRVKKFGGAITAEHGIGQLRKNELEKHKSKNEIYTMRKIKKLFDPQNILNPGKVI